MRLIDADALLAVPNVCKVTEYDESGCGVDYNAVPVKAIEHAPTIDAVQVVRCEDCKYRGIAGDCPMCHTEYIVDEDGYCDYYDVDNTTDDGFCDRGEPFKMEDVQ